VKGGDHLMLLLLATPRCPCSHASSLIANAVLSLLSALLIAALLEVVYAEGEAEKRGVGAE
jgi:hypothetical protein